MGKKSVGKLIVCAIALILAMVFSASAPVFGYKVVLPDTNLYRSADINSEVIAVMPQNAGVALVGESFAVGEVIWQKVVYNTIEGYVLAHDIYESREIDKFDVKRAKARASKIGEDINLYISNDVASGVAQVVHDGEYFNIIITKIDYGEFHLVEYKGERCFALKTNVSELLSLNETLALIIGGAAAAVTVAIIIILIVVKNKKLYKETA